MAVLSDTQIRRLIDVGELVLDGDHSNVEECSYGFRPGRGFLAGAHEPPVDLAADAAPDLPVPPGRMVWVRTRERVRIPGGMVGFWWQTSTLSRKGLMLVNMSMVEPGYEGDLACLFVNFGGDVVVIDRDTTIAKMVFIELAAEAEGPAPRNLPRSDYDAALRQLAANQPESFLKVGDLASDLDRQRREAAEHIERSAAAALLDVKAGADRRKRADEEAVANAVARISREADDRQAAALRDIETARSAALDGFKTDITKAAKGTLGWVAAVLVAFALVVAGGRWVRDHFLPDDREIARAEAEKVLRERTVISAAPGQRPDLLPDRRLQQLDERLDRIERRLR